MNKIGKDVGNAVRTGGVVQRRQVLIQAIRVFSCMLSLVLTVSGKEKIDESETRYIDNGVINNDE